MRVFNSKLAAIGLAAFVFASCSDSNSDPGSSPILNPDVTTIGLTQTNGSTVVNYKNSTANARKLLGSRAADATTFAGLTEMPTIPSLDGATKLNAAQDLDGQVVYTQGDGKEFDFTGKSIKNSTIFVEGGTTLKYDATGNNNTFYVKGGAKLIFKGNGSAVAANDKVIVAKAGTFRTDATQDLVIDGKLFAYGYVGKVTGPSDAKTPTQNVTINGDVYLEGYSHEVTDKTSPNYGKTLYEFGSLRAKTLTINAGARVNTGDKIVYTNDVVLAGALHVAKTAEVDNLTINAGGNFSSDSSIKVKKALTMNAGSKITTDYLNVTDNKYDGDGKETPKVRTEVGSAVATLNGNAQIVIGDHGVINTNILKTDNSANQIVLGGGENNIAVIKADKFVYSGDGEVQCISTPNTNNQVFLLQFTNCYKNGSDADANAVSFDDLSFAASYLDYDKATDGAELEPTANHTWKLKDEAKIAQNPKLDLYATLNAPADNQSATSILPYTNGKIYVSYHTQGNTFGGNIEVAQMSGNQLQVIEGANQATPTYDFNHLNVINNKLFLAGSDHAGAIVGYVGLNGDGTLNTTDGIKAASIDNKVEGDANCVVSFGNNVVVANTKGYDILNTELTSDHNVAAPGKAKFLAVSGSNLIGLNYNSAISAGNAAVEGTVKVFNSNDLSTTAREFSVGQIAPNNGKNMVAVDSNGRIYVCKSAKGLACYNADGTKAWENDWVTPTATGNASVDNRQGYINGVTVDDNYVYVAAGSYGLVVLDKNGNEITHRYIGKQNNSANYVAVKDGLIYVAYGKGRVQVFKLTDTVNK